MRILISGSSGMLGTAVMQALSQENHELIRMIRPGSDGALPEPSHDSVVRWDTYTGKLEGAKAEGADALIHLAGASIGDGRWTPARKNVLRTSRVEATRALVAHLSQMQSPPKIMVAASAIGYYGNCAEDPVNESSPAGRDFLAGLCREWEAESQGAAKFGARVVMLRFGVILSARGGALPRMALPFKLGAGGRLGSGRQWMSWIALPDAVGAIRWALSSAKIAGPVNVVTPNPVRNAEFTRELAKALHRPAIFPAPAFALRIAFGEMADDMLLASQRVAPDKLQRAGFAFTRPDLPGTLQEIFKRAH